MHKKVICFLLLWFVLFYDANAQSITFEKAYNLPDHGISHGVRQTNDSGYVLIGQQFPFGDSIVLIKTNPYGDTLWTRNYCGNYAYWLEVTSDSGYIFCGTSSYYCNDTTNFGKTLIKTNSSGDTLWTKRYGNVFSYLRCVRQTYDGGFVLCGNSNPNVIKTDSLGNIEWSRFIPVSDLLSIRQTYDSGYIIVGYAGFFNDSYYAAKLDTGGYIQWYKTFYGLNGEQLFYDVVQIPDSGFLFVGDYPKTFVRTDKNGDTLWIKNTGLNIEWANSVSMTQDNGFIVTMHNYNVIYKLDSACNIQWSKALNIFYYNSSLYSAQQTSDLGYIASGVHYDSVGTSMVARVLLVKFDSLGNLNTNVNEIKNLKTLVYVYPNPMHTESQLLIQNFHYSNLKNPVFTLYDLAGKQINAAPIKQWPFIIKRNNLQRGMYFYRVNDEKGLMLSGKLIMQ